MQWLNYLFFISSVQDLDYRVREAAQHVMFALVKKAGRNIAPYLKNLMGAWLLNQCDTYPTVASAAYSAFTNSFSPHKQKDVWSFSKDSILEVPIFEHIHVPKL